MTPSTQLASLITATPTLAFMACTPRAETSPMVRPRSGQASNWSMPSPWCPPALPDKKQASRSRLEPTPDGKSLDATAREGHCSPPKLLAWQTGENQCESDFIY